MKIIEAYKVPDGNVSPDIFRLPCVYGADKSMDKTTTIYAVGVGVDGDVEEAEATDWICKDIHGKWHVLTDEQYKQFTKRE